MKTVWNSVASDYLASLTGLISQIDLAEVTAVVERLQKVRESGGTIFIAGNGGSAATADHWVNDLCKMSKNRAAPAIRAIGLSAQTSYLTALGNDEGYERIFAGQLETYAEAGDTLIVISASGNSSNLVEAVRYAKTEGIQTAALLGFDGGALKTMVDYPVHVATEKGAYQHAEDCHSILCHLITTCLITEKDNG